MLSYVKFLKDILANKRKIGENEIVELTYECSALFQNNILKKIKDPRSFTLSCSIKGKEVRNALCDLGASINLMPLSIFKKLDIGDVRPTTVTLQLADRSITHLKGKIEDVLVQVDKFIFPANFIILNYEANTEVSIILGRPFLATGCALIDIQKGELTIREGQWHELQEGTEEEYFEIGAMMEESYATIQTYQDFESIKLFERLTQRIKPSLEEPTMLEMKALLVHLKYVYLGGNDTLPVIISTLLSKSNKEASIQVLKKYAKALGWTLTDIRGISPSYFMHKIRL
ncbi:uncharacterized protein LOC120076096 [Benincasa hispida]|uniref:uncharacterized protein LOC120076096 n=1 Tax=Benincasa hispida TaxID=102211 RepID=UPI00190157A5|nr:uncharacterized protein LOC120076096 [Benincasa hispida]